MRMRHCLAMAASVAVSAAVVGAGAASAAIVKAPIELVSHDVAGGYGDADSDRASASSGMQSIAFISSASDLDAPSNGDAQVYVRDRASGRLELITVGTGGKPAVGDAQSVAISADGQKVAFTSAGADIIPGLTPAVSQAYLHDRSTGQTILLSHDAMGAPSSKPVRKVDIDDAGDTVAFDTAGELTSVTGNGVEQVYVWRSGTIQMASVDPTGTAGGTMGTEEGLLSPDGRIVAFTSFDQLSASPANGSRLQSYARYLDSGTTVMISTSPDGSASADKDALVSAVLDDGTALIATSAANLAPGLTLDPVFAQLYHVSGAAPGSPTRTSILVTHTAASATTASRADVGSSGISSDGTYVVFDSRAVDLTTSPKGTGDPEIYSWDPSTGVVSGESVDVSDPGRLSGRGAGDVSVAPDGSGYAFTARTDGLVTVPTPPIVLVWQVYAGFRAVTTPDPTPSPSASGGAIGTVAQTGRDGLAATGLDPRGLGAAAVLLIVAGLGAGLSFRRRTRHRRA